MRFWLRLALAAAAVQPAAGEVITYESARYLRPAGGAFETECRLEVFQRAAGRTVTSRTERGSVRMVVEARYDADDRLTGAKAVLTTGGTESVATVVVRQGRATVRREGREAVELEAPPGVIVTSAPDWSDVFLLCRRYDRRERGRQEFPGLWIHPSQAPLRLTFAIEWRGTDLLQRDGLPVPLDRYLIRIRGNSAYAAWADAHGRMVRLIPLPAREPPGGLTAEGWESDAAALRPPP